MFPIWWAYGASLEIPGLGCGSNFAFKPLFLQYLLYWFLFGCGRILLIRSQQNSGSHSNQKGQVIYGKQLVVPYLAILILGVFVVGLPETTFVIMSRYPTNWGKDLSVSSSHYGVFRVGASLMHWITNVGSSPKIEPHALSDHKVHTRYVDPWTFVTVIIFVKRSKNRKPGIIAVPWSGKCHRKGTL